MSTEATPGETSSVAAVSLVGGRRAVVFAVVTAALFVSAIDQTIVAIALGAIQQDLGTTLEWSGWTVTIYALGQVVMLPIAGALADRLGRKRLLLIAIAVFGVASLACGAAPNIQTLLVLRFIQALGGGTFLPSVTGIVTEHFGRSRDRALGLFSSVFWLGGAFGPVIGGLIVSALSWRWIFQISAPLCAVLLVFAVIFIPGDRSRLPGRLDVFGLTILATFLLSGMFGVSLIGDASGFRSWVPLLAFALAAVLGVALVVWLRSARDPFVVGWLIWGKGFRVMNLINLLSGISAVGFTFLVPIYAENRFHLTALQTGTLLSGRAIGTICMAGVATFALRRTGYRLPMYVGFGALAIGSAGVALVPDGVPPYLWLAIATIVCGLGQGISFPAANTAITRLAPERASSISGLRSLFRQSGSIASVSIATAAAAAATDPSAALSVAFLVFAVLLAVAGALARGVPEHRGSW